MREHLAWPFFDDGASRAGPRASMRGLGNLRRRAARRCRRGVPRARARARRCGLAARLRAGAARRRVRDARRARDLLSREMLARHERARGLRVRNAGARQRRDLARRQRRRCSDRYLPRVCAGEAIAAFALSERRRGSDVAALQTRARPEGAGAILDGEKTWISNGGIADFYVVFARTGAIAGRAGHRRVRGRCATLPASRSPRASSRSPRIRSRRSGCASAASRRPHARRCRRRLRAGDAHARRLSSDAWPPRRSVRAPRLDETIAHARRRGGCSARRSRTSNSRRPRSPTWPPRSTRRRC